MSGKLGPDDAMYLEHMLEAIARARRYVARKSRTAFFGNTLLQDGVVRNIEVLGEAAGRLSTDFTARHPEIPWSKITGMRHRLIHGYMDVDLETVWDVAVDELRLLEHQLRATLKPSKRPIRKKGRK